jgi:chemotaxis protein methyltransferase CheR
MLRTAKSRQPRLLTRSNEGLVVISVDPMRTARNLPSLGYGDYLRFSQLVRERCGLHFPENRREDLERGVRQAFAASTCSDLNEYYRFLQDPNSSIVHFERLVNAITISETHFFRDAGQVDALYSHVLPFLIKRRRALRTLRIWSGGCASGEEPYSIAMLLRELLPDVDEWSITILGTDINTEAIDRARQAVYSEWAFREERAKEWRSRYFRRRGNRYELIPAVKRMVTFAQFNLVEGDYPSYESNTTLMDLILCRNVMIYFTEPISRRIVDRFYNCLTYGGWLVVGHAEHSLTIYRRFQVHNFPNAILYQRTDESTPPPKDWEWLTSSVAEEIPPALRVAVPKEGTPTPSFLDALPIPSAKREPPVRLLETEPKPQTEPESELDHVYIDALGRLGHVDPIERAKELVGYGRSEEARDLLVGMVDAGSKDPIVYAQLGQAYANLADWDEAERWCRQAIRVD